MASVGETDETSEGLTISQAQQEDAAELTELQTVLYQDQGKYQEFLKGLVESRVASAYELSGRSLTPEQLNKARDIATVQILQETANLGFIDDPETGEYRPIRNGDLIQIAWGSNEDLDALYLEESPDPRSEEGSLYRELLRDQVRANSDFEQDLLNDPSISIPSSDDEYADNDLHLRRVAYYKAERISERRPDVPAADIREEALRRTRGNHSKLTTVEGEIVAGRFLKAKDIWDENEFQIRRLEACIRHNRIKKRPESLNWNSLRPLPDKLRRSKSVKLLSIQAQREQVEQTERRQRILEARPELKSVLG
jgi:hypothetical protein